MRYTGPRLVGNEEITHLAGHLSTRLRMLAVASNDFFPATGAYAPAPAGEESFYCLLPTGSFVPARGGESVNYTMASRKLIRLAFLPALKE